MSTEIIQSVDRVRYISRPKEGDYNLSILGLANS